MLLAASLLPAHAEAKKEFNIAWSIYVGWMPWPYAADAGIVKKWADKYGITINITQINDYVESINQYTAGKFDGVTVTNMDALTIPAAGGVDTSAIIMGDFSNGNDGVVLKDGKTLADIKGRDINIVELSVSHYLLARGLTTIGLSEKDVKTVNTSDADIVAAFKAPKSTAVVTWNPQLMEVKADPGATEVFEFEQDPGRDRGSHGDQYANAEGQPRPRQGAGRRLVRDHRAHEGGHARGQGRPRGDGQALRHRSRRLRGAAQDDADVLHAGRRACLHHRSRSPPRSWTSSAPSPSSTPFSAKASNRRTRSASRRPAAALGDANNIKLRFDPTYMQMAADGKL